MGAGQRGGQQVQGASVRSEFERGLQSLTNGELKAVLQRVAARDASQPEFLQAVLSVAAALEPMFERRPELLPVFERMCEPERQVAFRVAWLDDHNRIQINRGYRIQFNSTLGPYKGGLRFHPSVSASVMKFLGFEQTLKNSLTGMGMGGGKGGADFDPKGKSDGELMRFCQSYMTELAKYIGGSIDVPAGDIGVGTKEIGYLYGQWKRLTMEHTPVLTGKGTGWGGSAIRPEATGYGVVFLAEEVLRDQEEERGVKGKRCLVSGAGNVAQHCAAKLVDQGAVVLTLSDSKGCIYKPGGLSREDVEKVMAIKSSHSGSLEELRAEGVEYHGDRAKPWQLGVPVDMAIPCATENEVGLEDAQSLVEHGCKLVLEGANMPCTAEAAQHLMDHGVTFLPGKAANAGGVAVSWLEIIQNRAGTSWGREEVEERLRGVMQNIYRSCKAAAEEYGTGLPQGASIAGFLRVADAMVAQGAV